MVVISDTSCLIVLRKLNRLTLLRDLYVNVVVTRTVADEYGFDLPEWFTVVDVQHTERLMELNRHLDQGEAGAIALAESLPDSLLIIDESKGRGVAMRLSIATIGTLGVLVKAKEAGLVHTLKPILTELRTETNFRFSEAVEQAILQRANELD